MALVVLSKVEQRVDRSVSWAGPRSHRGRGLGRAVPGVGTCLGSGGT